VRFNKFPPEEGQQARQQADRQVDLQPQQVGHQPQQAGFPPQQAPRQAGRQPRQVKEQPHLAPEQSWCRPPAGAADQLGGLQHWPPPGPGLPPQCGRLQQQQRQIVVDEQDDWQPPALGHGPAAHAEQLRERHFLRRLDEPARQQHGCLQQPGLAPAVPELERLPDNSAPGCGELPGAIAAGVSAPAAGCLEQRPGQPQADAAAPRPVLSQEPVFGAP